MSVAERVEEIRASAGDDERAHGLEDKLWSDVLGDIATGTLIGADAAEAARLALTTADIDFCRWRA